MTNIRKTLKDLFGYEVARAQRITILTEVKETGKDIREIASKYILPEMAILQDDLTFWDHKKEKYTTVAEWEKTNPLGPFGKIVVIGTQKLIDKYHKSKIE